MPILNKTKHQSVLSDLQNNIIISIAEKGKSSQSSLTRYLKKHQPDVNGSCRILLNKGLIEIIDEKQGRGKKEIFFGLTKKGVYELIKNPNFDQESFWQMIFMLYDSEFSNSKISVPINNLLKDYLQINLNLKIDHIPFYVHKLFSVKDTLSGFTSQVYFDSYQILEYFGTHGPQNIGKISKISQFSFQKTTGLIDLLLTEELLIKSRNKNQIKCSLSNRGLVYVLSWLFRKSSTIEQNNFKNKIQQIVKNSEYLLPHVFQNWGFLQRNTEKNFLLELFDRLYFDNQQYVLDKIDLQNSRIVGNTLQSMELIYRNKINSIITAGCKSFKKWLKKEEVKIEIHYTNEIFDDETINKFLKRNISREDKLDSNLFRNIHESVDLERIQVILKVLFELNDLNALKEGVGMQSFLYENVSIEYFKEVEKTEQYLEELITFQYFFLLKENTKDDLWSRLLARDKKLRKMFGEWMENVVYFSEENQRIIKRMKNF